MKQEDAGVDNRAAGAGGRLAVGGSLECRRAWSRNEKTFGQPRSLNWLLIWKRTET